MMVERASGPRLSSRARRTAVAVARTLIPAGATPAADDATVSKLEAFFGSLGRPAIGGFEAMLATLENAARVAHRGRPFSKLSFDEAETFLQRWSDGTLPQRTLALALTAPIKIAYYDDPAIYDRLNCTFRFHAVAEKPRWMQQVTRGADVDASQVVECDAVVVGTGAGGAVVAKELAEAGHAVLMLEEGEYHTRADFHGGAVESFRKFYRQGATIGSVGNTFIPIPMGRLVGGSTAINTGTCWRTPEWVLTKWGEQFGLRDLSPERMRPYFERVEREIEVAPADRKYLGGVANVIARGCDVLGYSHRPLNRNAPSCDGSGVCDFGCPTDARRSTNVSYVPAALRRGANLFTGVRADRVWIEDGRAVGIEARVVETGKTLRVRAKATILSGGTIPTPVLLQRQGLHRGRPNVGKNLSMHPATMVSARFDEDIRGYAAIPQGYCVDQFQREGILFLGASAPIDLGAAQFTFVGRKLVDVMDHYDRIASFGVMVEDGSIGRVLAGPRGRPLVYYWVGERERSRLQRGTAILSRIFLAAGASEVYPALHGHRVIRGEQDVARLDASHPAPADWLLTAFHPLGTCRMATDVSRGVVDTDHEVFGLPGLFIADGSVVPSSVAVNPQETIMALATRAAERIAARLG